jgi:hypothetical protein
MLKEYGNKGDIMSQENIIRLTSSVLQQNFRSSFPEREPCHSITQGLDQDDHTRTLNHRLEYIWFPNNTMIEIEDDMASLELENIRGENLSIRWKKPASPSDKPDYSHSLKFKSGFLKELSITNARHCSLFEHSYLTALNAAYCTEVFLSQTKLREVSTDNVQVINLSSNEKLEKLSVAKLANLKKFETYKNPNLKTTNSGLRLIEMKYDSEVLNGANKLILSDGSHHVYEAFRGTSDEILAQMHNKIDLERSTYAREGRNAIHPVSSEWEHNAFVNAMELTESRKTAITPTPEPSEADVRALTILMYGD